MFITERFDGCHGKQDKRALGGLRREARSNSLHNLPRVRYSVGSPEAPGVKSPEFRISTRKTEPVGGKYEFAEAEAELSLNAASRPTECRRRMKG